MRPALLLKMVKECPSIFFTLSEDSRESGRRGHGLRRWRAGCRRGWVVATVMKTLRNDVHALPRGDGLWF